MSPAQDPSEILGDYGADALRLYLVNSPVVHAETLRFKKEGVFGVIKDVLLPWCASWHLSNLCMQAIMKPA